MNIMKTNMLLSDNKIMKDNSGSTTVQAPVPSTEDPQKGMNALMFQGMRNLMANPKLAQGMGVMNDKMAESGSANSYVAPYSSNVAFKSVASKAKMVALAGLMTLGAAAMTSCEKAKDELNVVQKVDVKIDVEAITSLLNTIQDTMMKMYQQQQLSDEQFQQYAKDMALWRNQVNSSMGNVQGYLETMGNDIFDIKNGVKEENSYQQLMIKMLQQYMTKEQAEALLNSLIKEIKDGNKTQSQAMQELLSKLDVTNSKLNNIILNQEYAFTQRESAISILKNLKGDTSNIKDAVKLANEQLIDINKSIIAGNNNVVASIKNIDLSGNADLKTVADAIGWSTAQLIGYLSKLGIDIQNNNNWNAGMIIAAINYNTAVNQETNNQLADLRADFNAGRITAQEYADLMLEAVDDINTKLGILVEDFTLYADEMSESAAKAIDELKRGNRTAEITKNMLGGVLANQQKALVMLNIMNQNIKKIDIDMNAGMDKLAAQLGCSTAQIVGTLQFLGYTQAQIQNMNAGAVINAIKGASNSVIAQIGDKIDTVISKMGSGSGTLTDAEVQEIIALLQSIDGSASQISDTQKEILDQLKTKLGALGVLGQNLLTEVQNMGGDVTALNNKADELITVVKNLAKSFNTYAQLAMNAENEEIKLLNDIKAKFPDLSTQLATLINQGKKAEVQRQNIEDAINSLKLEVEKLEAKVGRPITPEELDGILALHDAANQQFYSNLIKNSGINPADFSTIEALLTAINTNLVDFQGTTNKLLADILARINAMDTTAPDYTAKLNQIIDLMQNFKFVCNCQCDCDDNNKVHEGIIGIIS